jgi:hypothetical protein
MSGSRIVRKILQWVAERTGRKGRSNERMMD